MLFACIPVVLLLSVALWAVSLHPQAFPRQISRLFSSHHLPDVSAVMNREDMASPRICSEHPQQCAELRILSLNVWGIPVSKFSPSKFYICLLVLEFVSIFVVVGGLVVMVL